MKRTSICMFIIALTALLFITSCDTTPIASAKLYLRPDRREYDAAIEQCKIAIKETPNNPEAYYLLGSAYGKKAMYPEMNEAFTNSLKISDKFKTEIEQEKLRYWTNLFNAGLAANRQNQLEEAVSDYKMGIALLPNRTEAYKNLAFTYSQLEETDLSIETYKKAIQIDPNDLELKYNLGMTYYKAQNYEEAVLYFQEVIDKGDRTIKGYTDSMIHLAFSYDLLQQPDKAMDIYKKALEETPNDKDLLFNLGRLYINREEYGKAIEILMKVLELDPNDFYANMGLANSYLKLEQYEKAIPFYEKAVEIKPDNANAWYNLGITYYRAGMPDKSKVAFDKSESLKTEQE
jgi:tetratricopeptide (TPR) repeat protein